MSFHSQRLKPKLLNLFSKSQESVAPLSLMLSLSPEILTSRSLYHPLSRLIILSLTARSTKTQFMISAELLLKPNPKKLQDQTTPNGFRSESVTVISRPTDQFSLPYPKTPADPNRFQPYFLVQHPDI